MSGRSAIILVSAVLCGAALWGVLAQGRQLSGLRAQQQHLEAVNPATNAPATEIATPEVPRELLQLRAEVARLSQQQRELASARPENERLRLQLENRRTNSAAANSLGAGYVRMSEVKWRGYNTPEDTLQSAFWAIQNHDLGKYLETIRPDVSKEIGDRLRNRSGSADEFFQNYHLPPIFKIAGRHQDDDQETLQLQIEIAPDIPPQGIFFRRVGGQWKLESSL
jgi:hypothetical protein